MYISSPTIFYTEVRIRILITTSLTCLSSDFCNMKLLSNKLLPKKLYLQNFNLNLIQFIKIIISSQMLQTQQA